MMRYLKGNKGTRFPSNLCFLDVAGIRRDVPGYPHQHDIVFHYASARFCRFVKWEQTRGTTGSYTTPAHFWAKLDTRLSRHRPLWVFAHGMTQAVTLLGLWQLIDDKVYELERCIDGDPPVIIHVRSNLGRIKFVCLTNWFRQGAVELSKHFGPELIPDRQGDMEVDCLEKDSIARTRMVEEAVIALMLFVKEHDLGNWRSTAASQAMQAYRHRFGPRKTRYVKERDNLTLAPQQLETVVWPMVHDDVNVRKLERAAFYGGQDECYFVGRVLRDEWKSMLDHDAKAGHRSRSIIGPVYHIDCNSAYPYVMKTGQYPCKLFGWQHECSLENLACLLDKYIVIANVKIQTNKDTYPKKKDGRVLFVRGKYWTTLAADELKVAFALGYVTQVGYHAAYVPMDLFSSYVDFFYDLKLRYKQSGNDIWYALTKLYLNALHGKFMEGGKRWVPDPEELPVYRWGKWIGSDYDTNKSWLCRSIAGVVQRQIDDYMDIHSMYAIGSCVSANVREYMRSVKEVTGYRNVLYQGTDSLIVLPEGYARIADLGLLDETQLGLFRNLGCYQTAEIHDAQAYTLGETKKQRGLPQDARQIAGQAYTFTVRNRLGNMLFTVPAARITYSEVDRLYEHSYAGGSVQPDGWVEPFALDAEENDYERT